MRKFVLLTVAVLTVLAVAASTALAARGGPSVRGNAVQGQQACTGTLASGTTTSLSCPQARRATGLMQRSMSAAGCGSARVRHSSSGSRAGSDTGTIHGGVRADAPASLQVHFAHITGGVRMLGGNGFFSTVEDNVIRGGARIIGYSGFWLGFIRNTVYGTVKLNDNHMDDPDANEYVTNTIHGNLNCAGNSPAPQVGDSEGSPNQVTGRKTGQCAGL